VVISAGSVRQGVVPRLATRLGVLGGEQLHDEDDAGHGDEQ
jgi:hypothetical protein